MPPVLAGRLLRALLVALMTGPPGTSELTAAVPEQLSGVDDLAQWEQYTGHADFGSRDVAYRLYVDRLYPSLYRLTRYQVTVVARSADGRELRSLQDETLVWNVRPGTREPLACYTLRQVPAGPARWQAVPSGSDEYWTAMQTVVDLYRHYSQHRTDLLAP